LDFKGIGLVVKIHGGTAGVQVCKNPGYLPILQPSARKALKIDHILRAALKTMLTLVLLAMSAGQVSAGEWSSGTIDRVLKKAGLLEKQGKPRQAVELYTELLLESGISADDDRRSDAFYGIGDALMKMHAYNLAREAFLRADKIDQAILDRSNYFLITQLGVACMRMQDWDPGERYFRRALKMLYGEHPVVDIASGLNNLGIFFEEKGELDSAMVYYEAALIRDRDFPGGDRSFVGSIRDNMASVQKKQGRYAEAMGLYEENVQLFETRGKPRHWVRAHMGLAEMLLKFKQPGRALAALEAGYARFPKVVPRFKEDLIREWLQLRIHTATQMRDVEAVSRFSERLISFEDSIRKQLTLNIEQLTGIQGQMQARALQRTRALQESELREQKAKLKQLRLERRQTWIAVGSIAVVIVLLIFILVRWLHFRSQVLSRQIKLNTAQNELLREQFARERLAKENLELKVALNEQDLTNFALDNRRKRELLQQIGKRLKLLKPTEVNRANIRSILNEMLVQMQDETTSKLMEDNVEEVNAAFRARLLRLYPQLTQKDIELCGMVRLGMQTKEIAAQRNVTEGAVKQARKRLRKKLELDPNVDLRKFLQET
jgi:tetratricopeptide (TPR) repeat protein